MNQTPSYLNFFCQGNCVSLKSYDDNAFLNFFRGLSFAYAPISGVPNTSQFPQMGYMVECSIYQSNTKLLKCGISVIRNMPPSITSFTSFIGGHSYRALTRNFCLRDVWHATQTCEPQFGGKSSEGETKSEEETHFSCFDDFDFEDDPELLRRRRIGLANKGKVPWNKGKKHSAGNTVYIILYVIVRAVSQLWDYGFIF